MKLPHRLAGQPRLIPTLLKLAPLLGLNTESEQAKALALDVEAWIFRYWRDRLSEPWRPNAQKDLVLFNNLAEKIKTALEQYHLTADAWSYLFPISKLLEQGISKLQSQPTTGKRKEEFRHMSYPLSFVCRMHSPKATKQQIRAFAADVFEQAGITTSDAAAHPDRIDALLWFPSTPRPQKPGPKTVPEHGVTTKT